MKETRFLSDNQVPFTAVRSACHECGGGFFHLEQRLHAYRERLREGVYYFGSVACIVCSSCKRFVQIAGPGTRVAAQIEFFVDAPVEGVTDAK